MHGLIPDFLLTQQTSSGKGDDNTQIDKSGSCRYIENEHEHGIVIRSSCNTRLLHNKGKYRELTILANMLDIICGN